MGNSKEGDREEDMSGLGATALISCFIDHLCTHGWLYLGILVLIVLPTVAVEQVLLRFTGLTSSYKPEFVLKLVRGDFTDVEVEPAMILQMTASTLAFGLLQVVLFAFRYICIVYTVASFLTNQTVVLADAAGAVGRLWKPVILTSLSLFAASYGLPAIGIAILYAVYLLSSVALILQVGIPVIGLVVVFIRFAFQMGLVVPVLEGVYGWKALGRSWRLLEGKKWVALRMIILRSLLVGVPAILLVIFVFWVLTLVGISTISTTGSVLTFAADIVISSVNSLLVIGTQTFLYFSCKALHQERITDSAFFQAQVMKGGYERISQHPESYDVENANTPGG